MTLRPSRFACCLDSDMPLCERLRPQTFLLLMILGAGAGLLGSPGAASAQECTPDPPMDGDTVTCTDTISDGYDVREFDDLDISINGNSVFDESGTDLETGDFDSAIRIGDETSISIGADTIINVTEEDGFGIQGDNNNFVDNNGTININGESGRGIKIDNNTTGILPNGAINNNTGRIIAIGDNSVAMETGTNSGVATSGLIDLVGDGTRGISAGSREDLSALANITNSGTINVGGDDGFGVIAGDNWIDGVFETGDFTPEAGGIRNFGDINVSGDQSVGIFAGDDTNSSSNHNSFVINGAGAVINVTGEDSMGISIGGNDILDPSDSDVDELYTLENEGLVMGGPNAGPLIQIRNFVEGFENRILNETTGDIFADTTSLGTDGRGIAVLGSDGDDVIDNLGDITGNVDLGLGNDTYIHGESATFQDSLSLGDGNNTFENQGLFDAIISFGEGNQRVENFGTFEGNLSIGSGNDAITNTGDIDGGIDLGDGDDTYTQDASATVSGMIIGGDGDDAIQLNPNLPFPAATFDLNQTQGFETVRLLEATATNSGWDLLGTESFTGLVEVLNGAAFRPAEPRTLAGSLTVAPGAALVLPVDGITPALTVEGTSTFAGNALLDFADNVAPTSGSPVRIISTLGDRVGEFDLVLFNTPAIDGVFSPGYDDEGFFILFDPSLAALVSGETQQSIAQHLTDINTSGSGSGSFQGLIDAFFAANDQGFTDLTPFINGLSPEGYDAHTTVAVEAGRQISSLLMDRPRECESGQSDRFRGSDVPLPCHARTWSPWLATTGSFRERDGFDGRPSYDAQIGGLVFGLDARPIGDLSFTLALSSQHGTIDVGGFGESRITTTDISAHVAWSPGPLRIQAVGSWGHGFHEDERQIQTSIGGGVIPVNTNSETDHDSDRFTLAVEAGYLFSAGPITIEPLVGIDWAWINQRTIDEDEAPAGLALTVPGREDQIGSISAGMRLATTYRHDAYLAQRLEWLDGIWRPMVDVRWRQFLEGDQRDFDARFDGSPDDIANFSVQAEEDSGGLEVGAGLSFIPDVANRLQFDLRYEAYVAANTLQHDLVGRVSLGF